MSNGCPICKKALPSGDVPPESVIDCSIKSDAQKHIAKCIAGAVQGDVKDALNLLVWGDEQFEELFGAVVWPQWVCSECAAGNHASHDNHGKPWDGTSRNLDSFDCKVQRDRSTQCLCRANWPRDY